MPATQPPDARSPTGCDMRWGWSTSLRSDELGRAGMRGPPTSAKATARIEQASPTWRRSRLWLPYLAYMLMVSLMLRMGSLDG
jgi:hypothetical protein